MNLESAVRNVEEYTSLQGYLLLGVGTILTLFSLGFFPLLKWGIFAAGLGLALWGASKAHIAEKMSHIYQSIRNMFNS